jgi:hypothetical protein
MSDEKRELKAGQVWEHSNGELVVIQSVEAGWIHYKYARASMLKRTTIGSFFKWFTFVNDRWPQVGETWYREGPPEDDDPRDDDLSRVITEVYSDGSGVKMRYPHNRVIGVSIENLHRHYTRNPPAEANHDSNGWHLPSLPFLPSLPLLPAIMLPCDAPKLPLKQERPDIVSATISKPSARLPAALQRAINSLDSDRGCLSRSGAKELQELLRQLREHVSAALDLARCGRIKAGDYGYAIARGWDALGYYQGLLAGGAEAEMLDWVAICTDTAKASVRRGWQRGH